MLNDLLANHLDVVFCGTAAGTVSAEKGQYYAGPGNKFWNTLYRVGLTERQLEPGEFRTLLAKGIGFSDVVKDRAGMVAQKIGLPTGVGLADRKSA